MVPKSGEATKFHEEPINFRSAICILSFSGLDSARRPAAIRFCPRLSGAGRLGDLPRDGALAERREGGFGDLEVCKTEGNANDRQAVADADEDVGQGKPQTGKDAPEEVHDARSGDSLLADPFGRNEFLAKRAEREPSHPEASDPDRDPDDRAAPHDADQKPRKPEQDSASENEPKKITDERHNNLICCYDQFNHSLHVFLTFSSRPAL